MNHVDDGKLLIEIGTNRGNDDMQTDIDKIVELCKSWKNASGKLENLVRKNAKSYIWVNNPILRFYFIAEIKTRSY